MESFAATRFRKRFQRSLWRALRKGALAAHAVLFFGTWAVLPLADAPNDARSLTGAPRSHVEAAGARDCPRVHNEATCQICRVLSSVGSSERHATLLPTSGARSASAPTCDDIAPELRWLSQTRTRAPPASTQL